MGCLEEVVFCTGANTAGLVCNAKSARDCHPLSPAIPRGEEERRPAVKVDPGKFRLCHDTLLPAFVVASATPRGLKQKMRRRSSSHGLFLLRYVVDFVQIISLIIAMRAVQRRWPNDGPRCFFAEVESV